MAEKIQIMGSTPVEEETRRSSFAERGLGLLLAA